MANDDERDVLSEIVKTRTGIVLELLCDRTTWSWVLNTLRIGIDEVKNKKNGNINMFQSWFFAFSEEFFCILILAKSPHVETYTVTQTNPTLADLLKSQSGRLTAKGDHEIQRDQPREYFVNKLHI